MSNYVKTKKELDRIKDEYGTAGDVLFRTAIQYVVDCGQQNFEDEEWVKEQLDIIDKRHDAMDRMKKIPFISREFDKATVECASEIAKVNTYDLLVYIQREVWLSADGISYQRAIELLHSCMSWFIDYDCCSNKEMLKKFEDLDFTDRELEELGYGWLFEEEEE